MHDIVTSDVIWMPSNVQPKLKKCLTFAVERDGGHDDGDASQDGHHRQHHGVTAQTAGAVHVPLQQAVTRLKQQCGVRSSIHPSIHQLIFCFAQFAQGCGEPEPIIADLV